MNKTLRRWQRGVAFGLLFLNVTGARAVSVFDPAQSSRDFFAPSLAFRGIVAMAMRQDFKKPPQHALGQRSPRFSSMDFENLEGKSSLTEVQILPPTVALAQSKGAPRRAYVVWKLPTDLSPVKPPHLHSKK